jgi:hypothetical protein
MSQLKIKAPFSKALKISVLALGYRKPPAEASWV